MNRESISKRKRFEIFKRDGFECQYCGATPPGVVLHCDHIEPVSKGGSSDMDNLITACQSCNQGKSDIQLNSVPQSLSERSAEVKEREEQIAGYQEILRLKRERLEGEAQEILEIFCKSYGIDGIPKMDFVSIKRFVDKLGYHDCHEAAEMACSKFYSGYSRSFKYFCGICWSKIKEMDAFLMNIEAGK